MVQKGWWRAAEGLREAGVDNNNHIVAFTTTITSILFKLLQHIRLGDSALFS